MISVKELDFVKAHEQFQRMCEFLDQALSEGQRVDQVERGLFPQAMTMCLELLLLRGGPWGWGSGRDRGAGRRDAPPPAQTAR